MDQSKKTMRHFYCRDVLWETFEQMANDFDCSIDYLINEAMRYYARSKNYQSQAQPMPGPVNSSGHNYHQGGGQQYNQVGPSGRRPGPTGPPPPPPGGHSGRRMGAPTGRPGMNPPGMGAPGMGSPGMSPPPMAHDPYRRDPAVPTLYLIYNGQRYPIAKDQFIIGRGSKTSDLAIKDGNISRKHAAVIRRNGTYYIKDLGSTNGIDYKGMRIDNKRVDEGDIFHICDYELRFTYRPD